MKAQELNELVQKLNAEMVNKKQMMALLGLSQAGAWNLVRRGELNGYEVANFTMYSRAEVETLRAARKSIADAKAAIKVAAASTNGSTPAAIEAPKTNPTLPAPKATADKK